MQDFQIHTSFFLFLRKHTTFTYELLQFSLEKKYNINNLFS